MHAGNVPPLPQESRCARTRPASAATTGDLGWTLSCCLCGPNALSPHVRRCSSRSTAAVTINDSSGGFLPPPDTRLLLCCSYFRLCRYTRLRTVIQEGLGGVCLGHTQGGTQVVGQTRTRSATSLDGLPSAPGLDGGRSIRMPQPRPGPLQRAALPGPGRLPRMMPPPGKASWFVPGSRGSPRLFLRYRKKTRN